ncbi:MAG: hypothetical protein ABI835_05775 [Chloroflexota bacterium]
MEFEENAFKEIAENQIGFFGGAGQMLIPSRKTVEALIRKIPASQLITTDLLRKRLADDFGVQGTCPVTTKKVLRVIASDADEDVAYWRVIKQSGELIAYFPGGVEAQAALLGEEGFSFETSGKVPKVRKFKESLVHFD